MLKEAELLVATWDTRNRCGWAGRRRLFGAEGRIGQDQCGFGQAALALLGQRVAEADAGGSGVGVEAVQHEVHEGETVGVLHEFHAVEGAAAIFALLLLRSSGRACCAYGCSGWPR